MQNFFGVFLHFLFGIDNLIRNETGLVFSANLAHNALEYVLSFKVFPPNELFCVALVLGL